MPCNSDHMNPHPKEVIVSQCLTLLDELQGKGFDSSHYDGYHPMAYGKSLSKQRCDQLTASLCEKLQKTDVTKYSLEMQIWWCDHKKADEEREKREKEEKRQARLRKAAADRLTPKQRAALGIDNRGNRLNHTIEGRIPF